MKLVCIAVLISLCQLQASVNAQDAKIDIQLKDVNLDKVFSVIHEKTGYNFMFNHEDVSLFKVDATFKNSTVKKILDKILKGLPLSYKFEDNVVLIYHQKKDIKPKKTIVKGKVTDEKGDPLPGVTVIIKGTNVGVSTDVNGKFSVELSKVDKNSALLFSFIGMESKEVKVQKGKELKVVLKDKKEKLKEVVVTGYANINKKSFTGNAVSVKKEDIIKAAPKNVLQALQLFDPSLRLQESNILGSNPNALPEFYIRGRSGIGVTQLDKIDQTNLKANPNQPTFILDGFEVSVEKIYDLDINRIKSITILKDAAATAIYGSRAANGVIVIERVAPKAGELRVSYNLNLAITTPDLNDYNLFDAKGKLEAERLSGYFISDKPWVQSGLTSEYWEKYAEIAKGVNTDWLAVPTRTACNQTHSFYIEGGHEDLLFGIDLKMNNDDGVMRGSYRNGKGFGFHLTYRHKNLLFKNYVSFETTNSEESKFGDFRKYTEFNPYVSYLDENGEYLDEIKNWENTVIDNPYIDAVSKNYNKRKYETFTNNFSIDWFINDYLRLKSSISISKTKTDEDDFIDPKSIRYGSSSHDGFLKAGEKYVSDSESESFDISSLLIYNRNINKHNINLSCGVNIRENKDNNSSYTLRGFPTGIMDEISFAAEIVNKPYGMSSTNRLFGSFLNSNYSYNDIYLADISCRLDGSSAFGTEKKYATFWSGGLGLNLSNCKMFKKIEWLDYFKIRGSYGETGKTNFPANAAKTMYNYNTSSWYISGLGTSLSALGNENLKWEKTTTTDIGLDLQLFNHKFDIKATYYKKITSDLISPITIPASLGFSTYMGNTGELENKGYEVYFNSYLIQEKDVKFNIFFNLAHNTNKMTKIAKELKDYNEKVEKYYEDENKASKSFNLPLLKYSEGTSLTSIYAMKSLGINPANGREVYVKKDGELTYTWMPNETVICGDTEPDMSGTLGFNASFKKFSLYAAFAYEVGGQIYNTTLVNKVEEADIRYNADRRILTQRWIEPGDIAPLKDIKNWGTTTLPTSRFVQDNDFLAFRSLTLSYTLPDRFAEKLNMSMLKVQFNADNLFRLSSVEEERGLSYPFARTYNFTVNAKF